MAAGLEGLSEAVSDTAALVSHAAWSISAGERSNQSVNDLTVDSVGYSLAVRSASNIQSATSTHSSSGLLRQPCSDQDALRSRL